VPHSKSQPAGRGRPQRGPGWDGNAWRQQCRRRYSAFEAIIAQKQGAYSNTSGKGRAGMHLRRICAGRYSTMAGRATRCDVSARCTASHSKARSMRPSVHASRRPSLRATADFNTHFGWRALKRPSSSPPAALRRNLPQPRFTFAFQSTPRTALAGSYVETSRRRA